jgi:predicted O-methyltransferase YrrM
MHEVSNKILKLYNIVGAPSYEEPRSDNIHCPIIYAIVRALEPTTCVEIGSRLGHSALWTAQALKDNGKGHLWCIDSFVGCGAGKKPDFLHTIKVGEVSDIVTLIEDFSQNVVEQIPEMEFLFIDGGHSEEACYADMQNYIPKLKKGGIVMFHDYKPSTGTGVKAAINKYDFSTFVSIPLPSWTVGMWLEVKV